VRGEFEPKIAELERDINTLTYRAKEYYAGSKGAAKIANEITIKQKEIAELHKKQEQSIDEQYKIQQGQEIVQKTILEGIDEEESLSTELTESEKERLDIEKELIKIRYTNNDALETQIQKEIQLIKNSKTLYEEHAKNLKLEELNNKLIDARLQKRKKEENSLLNLSMQYEKADMFEKSKIRRVAELQMMPPEKLAEVYTDSMFDKNLITEYWNSFSNEAQDAISKTTTLFEEMGGKITLDEQLDNLRQTTARIKEMSVGYGGLGEPIVPEITKTQRNVINNYTIPITLEGAITNTDIQELLEKIEEELKKQPNYVGDTDLISQITEDSVKKKKLANILRPEM
jgi:hypothetical protein